MRRVVVAALVFLGVILGGASCLAVTVTWVADCGYSLQGSEVNVLIDGLLVYETPEERQVLMREAVAPFDADIILVTHSHFDHFDAGIVAANMSANWSAVLVAPRDVIRDVQDLASHLPEDRFHAVAPSTREPQTVDLPDLTITVYSLPHGPDGQPRNVGYLFELDSVVFFHPGDGDINEAGTLYESYALHEAGIDAAFLAWAMFLDAAVGDFTSALGARYLVPTHGTPSLLRMTCERAGDAFGDLFCFREYMESIEFEPGEGCPPTE